MKGISVSVQGCALLLLWGCSGGGDSQYEDEPYEDIPQSIAGWQITVEDMGGGFELERIAVLALTETSGTLSMEYSGYYSPDAAVRYAGHTNTHFARLEIADSGSRNLAIVLDIVFERYDAAKKHHLPHSRIEGRISGWSVNDGKGNEKRGNRGRVHGTKVRF